MKLFIVMLILSVNVSANAYSQNVDITVKNAPLLEVMRQVRKQTGYYFFFSATTIKNARPVSLNLKQASVDDALMEIFKEQPFTYDIKGKAITLKEINKPSSNDSENAMEVMQLITITGKVVDDESNPLPGATVKASGKATVTDANGDFSLTEVDESAKVEISFIGYVKKIVKATGDLMLIQMALETGTLNETIIKGYYTTTKTLNTGSVGTLKAADIAKQPVNDFGMALQGRIPGLSVTQLTGIPSAPLKVSIRGTNSIANGTDPLYIIDGVPFPPQSLSQLENATLSTRISPLNSIRPENIETITVLKDADATAIYGSRGANGVILITTKKGSVGKAKTDFNVYRGSSDVARFVDLMNTAEYLEMRNEAFKNDNATPSATRYDVNGKWSQDRYTDWQKVMIGGTAETYHVTGTLSGGDESTQYLLSPGYRTETTIFPGNYKSKIGTANLNLNHLSDNRKFRADLSLNYTYSDYNLPTTDYSSFIYMAPNAPRIYDENGKINWENNTFNNPIANTLQKSNSITDNLVSNLNLSYEILSQLQIKLGLGYNTVKIDETQVIPATSRMPSPFDDPAFSRAYGRANNGLRTWNVEPQLNYTKDINDHHIEGLIAATLQATQESGTRIDASVYPSDALIENPAYASRRSTFTNYSQYRYSAAFGRIGYNYKNKYVLNLTGRRDGSSRFGSNNRFGNFGAVGAAWIFSDENYVKDKFSFLSLGKVRASIGKTGNDQLGNYQFLSTYTGNGVTYGGVTGLLPLKLTNPNYGWETINKTELGFDLGFFNNRLLLNGSLYRNRTKNQLVGYTLPFVTGFSSVTANLPAVIQNSGFEIEVNSVNFQNHRFTWNTSFNISVPRNKLISFPNIEGTAYAQQYAVGMPLNVLYLYQYTGIDPNSGAYTFDDLNKDGTISFQDDRKPIIIGQKFFGGLQNSFTYKGVALDIFLQFVKQNGRRYIGNSIPGSYINTGRNQPVILLNRWRQSGDDAEFQRFNQNYSIEDKYNQFYSSNGRLTDASFIRLKNVMVSYSLPSRWISRLKLQNLRVYAQGQNLATVTKFKNVDPENGLGLPPLRTLTTGVQFTF